MSDRLLFISDSDPIDVWAPVVINAYETTDDPQTVQHIALDVLRLWRKKSNDRCDYSLPDVGAIKLLQISGVMDVLEDIKGTKELDDAIGEYADDDDFWTQDFRLSDTAFGQLLFFGRLQIIVPVLRYRHRYRSEGEPWCYAPEFRIFLGQTCIEEAEAVIRRAWAHHVMPYADYLQTDHWAWMVSRHKQGRCQLCGSERNLNLHHNTYVRRGFEKATDFLTLCRQCHKRFHSLSATTS